MRHLLYHIAEIQVPARKKPSYANPDHLDPSDPTLRVEPNSPAIPRDAKYSR